MKKILTIGLLVVSSVALADTAIVDPSGFTAGDDVTHAYPGVTLTTAQGTMKVYFEDVVEPLHLTSDIENPVYTTDARFAHASGAIWTANDYLGCCGGDYVLKIDFKKPATSVAVQFYPDDSDTAVLQIYDHKDRVLAETYVRLSEPTTVTLDAPRGKKIAYALATYADTGLIGAVSFSAPGKIR